MTAFHELLQSWCFATDLESFEHAGKEGARIIIGPVCPLTADLAATLTSS